jgi:hypothetical protein
MINFHKLIRQQRGKLDRFIDELHVGDSVFKTDTEILIGWKSHFANLAKESDRMDFDHSYLDTVESEYKHIIKLCQHDFIHETVSKEELDKALIDLIREITKLPNSEQSYKRKVKTHKHINRQNQ